jgi:hypothetical protein
MSRPMGDAEVPEPAGVSTMISKPRPCDWCLDEGKRWAASARLRKENRILRHGAELNTVLKLGTLAAIPT